ncbi:MAG: universal stress protein [Polyangiaceae bacterium]
MSDGEGPETGTEGGATGNAEHDHVIVLVAAIDTSSMASEVVETASRFARRAWPVAQLHFVHVFRTARFDRRANAGLSTDELLADAQSYLDHYARMARRLFAGSVTGHLAQGDPASEIVQRAQSLAADWLLIGTHDTHGLERLLLGSVADKVAKSAPCSVMVVRKKRRPFVKVP